MANKNVIRLNESQLSNIIKEAVKMMLSENIEINEAFKSQKLADKARMYGGLTYGDATTSFGNDIYNMTDEEFDDYEVVDADDHYKKYGWNSTENPEDLNNMNFKPLHFKYLDGKRKLMVKKHPQTSKDERWQKLDNKRYERMFNKYNDGAKEYQPVGPFKKASQYIGGIPRKDNSSNIDMDSVRIYNEAIKRSIDKVVNEAYGYPESCDMIILLAENDRETYDNYIEPITNLLAKKITKGVELSQELLANSSMMEKFWLHCRKKFAKEQDPFIPKVSNREFKIFWAEHFINLAYENVAFQKRHPEEE